MFKNGIKNFFINLKHFFTPLGTLFLGVAVGMSVFIPCLYSALTDTATDVNQLLQEMNVDFDAMWQSVVDSFAAMDWDNPSVALQGMMSGSWFSDTLNTALNSAVGDGMSTLEDKLPQIISGATDTIMTGLVALLALTALGIVVGHFLTASLVRKTIAKRAIWKVLLAFVVDWVLNLALVALCVWLATLWTYSIIFTLLVVAVITAYKSLIEGYFIQGLGKIGFREIVNFKNALQHLLSVLFIWVIVVAIVVVLYLFVNVVLAILVGLALMEIAIAVCNLNAEAYVKERAGE